MRAYWTLTRRELSGYFFSLSGYVIIAAATFLTDLSFYAVLKNLVMQPAQMPVTEQFYGTLYVWVILALTTPVITMRLFALEKFSGTFETLMTAPISDLQVVLAKFTAALVFYLVMWLPLLACLWTARYYMNDPAAFDTGTMGTMFLGIVLVGCLYLSIGCCASALSRSQAIAAVISLAFGIGLLLLSFLADQLPVRAGWQARLLGCFALADQMHDFARGVVDTRPVVLYLSLTLFFLYLTLRVVESRRWK
jgi:ABC-2 type transport system permease protein